MLFPLKGIGRAVVVALIASIAPTSAHGQGSVEDVASQLICMCGCNKLLNVCEMDTAKQMKAIISDKIAQGMSASEVVDFMTATYGEQVLAAPTKRGFNLTAWITPFAGIVGGGLVIWFIVLAWVRQRHAVEKAEIGIVASEDLESRYGTTLERELERFEA
ncbi:MAG: cytochrome c-type biogenesis protein CcmH [Gemmatimonadales bacterium]